MDRHPHHCLDHFSTGRYERGDDWGKINFFTHVLAFQYIRYYPGTILSRDPNIPCNVGLSPLGCGLAIVQLYAMFMDRSVRSDDEAVQIAFVGLIVVPLYLGTCLYQAVANADFDYEGHAAGVLVGFLFVLNELSNIKLTTPRGGAGQTRAQSDAAADAERKAEVRRRKQNQD